MAVSVPNEVERENHLRRGPSGEGLQPSVIESFTGHHKLSTGSGKKKQTRKKKKKRKFR